MPITRILQLTDLHLFASPDELLKGIPTRELLASVIAHIQQSGESIDHVVVTGDHTHDELPETYRVVRHFLAPWIDRLWQVPGNHDDRAALRSVFGDRTAGVGAERINFRFVAGNWICLGLDTHVPGQVPGRIDAEQVTWIRQQMADDRLTAAVLFMHHPPVLVGSVWLDRIGLEGKELVQELLLQEPRIRLVCCGHVHHESTHQIGNAMVVTTPSTGLQFSPLGDVATFLKAPPGYRMIELHDDGCTTRVIRLPEAVFTPTEQRSESAVATTG